MTLERTRAFFALLLLLMVAPWAPAETRSPARTVVIVHGAWGGGWDWKETAAVLESRGFEVHRPTLTGLGERRHLLSPGIDLTTHIADVVNVLRFEQLDDVILVGHSYGGMVITGVAEAIPERLERLVYFDAFLPFDGECILAVGRDAEPSELCTDEAAERMLSEPTNAGGIPPGWVAPGTPPRTDVPHPVGTFVEPIKLAGAPGNGVPAGYIITRETAGGTDDFNVTAKRAEELGFPVVEYVGNHVPHREDPEGVARLFVSFSPANDRTRE
ncbi:MAG: alpha/beta fold hydrolase [Gammaproteobacteria bacterium]|jgi:pimeloyl-ACP methyl ester carboxylesterase|nr:alpha/beta fold hydrolase [Gammaproteobacteria bacterium]